MSTIDELTAPVVEPSWPTRDGRFIWKQNATVLVDRASGEAVAHVIDRGWSVVHHGREVLVGLPREMAMSHAVSLAASQWRRRR